MEQMLGYTAAELDGDASSSEYTHPDDVEQNIRLFNEIMEGPREAYRFEKRCFRKDGQMIWLRVTSVAEVDEDGRRTHAITMLEDITERKLAEQAHARAGEAERASRPARRPDRPREPPQAVRRCRAAR